MKARLKLSLKPGLTDIQVRTEALSREHVDECWCLRCRLSADHKAVLLGRRGREAAAEAVVGDVRPAGGQQESSGGQRHQQRL